LHQLYIPCSCPTLIFPAKATYAAIAKTYEYLTPDLWKETSFTKSPYQEYSEYLAKNHRPVQTQKQEVKQY
jgi:small subunit ribosomal protein S2e